MISLPKKVPSNWYRYDVSSSMELIRSYAKGVEDQAKQTISNYETKRESVVVESVPEAGYEREITHYRGLDDETWDLEEIFRDHFPSLQRSSALVSLYGFFENELNRLCELYKNSKPYKIGFKDLTGQGIDRAGNYLEKVASLDIKRSSKQWKEIKKIQEIRNLVVHSNGSLVGLDGSVINDKKTIVEQTQFLTGESEVIVLEGYLTYVIDTFDNYFSLLNEEIIRQENA